MHKGVNIQKKDDTKNGYANSVQTVEVKTQMVMNVLSRFPSVSNLNGTDAMDPSYGV